MKIGVLTRRYGYNLGSTLQAYAMSEMIKELGHDVEIINYDESSAHPRWRLRPLVDHFLYPFKSCVTRKYKNYLEHRKLQEDRFNIFENRHLPLGLKVIRSTRLLSKVAAKYDKVCIGSDQIWNPFLFDPNYIGAFCNSESKHKIIPYAPSLGVSSSSSLPSEEIKLIRSLHTLSCREHEGAEILEQLTGKKVPVVLDPTLMVRKEIWYNLANAYDRHSSKTPYILTYFLGHNIPLEYITEVASRKKAQILNINMFNKPNFSFADKELNDIGPGDFLNLVMNASFIITDSFHATIFSWIFSKDFTVVERFMNGDTRNENSRIYTLLEILGCKSRVLNSKFEDSESKYELMFEKSLDYLKTHLNN